MHKQGLFALSEDVEDIEVAWELEEERKQGRHIPRYCHTAELLYYRQIAKYAQQLTRLYATVPKEQVKVILFDDFVADTQAVYDQVIAFLGVEHDGRSEFDRVNESKALRSKRLYAFLRHPPWPMNYVKRALKWVFGNAYHRVGGWLEARNTKTTPKPPLSDDFIQKMRVEYTPDIQQLEEMLGRSLAHWYDVK